MSPPDTERFRFFSPSDTFPLSLRGGPAVGQLRNLLPADCGVLMARDLGGQFALSSSPLWSGPTSSDVCDGALQ